MPTHRARVVLGCLTAWEEKLHSRPPALRISASKQSLRALAAYILSTETRQKWLHYKKTRAKSIVTHHSLICPGLLAAIYAQSIFHFRYSLLYQIISTFVQHDYHTQEPPATDFYHRNRCCKNSKFPLNCRYTWLFDFIDIIKILLSFCLILQVKDLKDKIEAQKGFPTLHQKLIYAGS